jgi:hypothetical protein
MPFTDTAHTISEAITTALAGTTLLAFKAATVYVGLKFIHPVVFAVALNVVFIPIYCTPDVTGFINRANQGRNHRHGH